jgi:hypothetical protein
VDRWNDPERREFDTRTDLPRLGTRLNKTIRFGVDHSSHSCYLFRRDFLVELLPPSIKLAVMDPATDVGPTNRRHADF